MTQVFIIYAVITLCYSLSIAFAEISPCATWNNTGVTIAGTGTSGSSSEQLHTPAGIFIHKQTNRLYIADMGNQRIQMFTLDHLQPQGNTVASLETFPYDIYVDDDITGPTIYVSLGWDDGHVEKWVNGTSRGVQVGGECSFCGGVWVDKNKNVYMAESFRHRVLKWSPATNSSTVIAGQTDRDGPTADLLYWPRGIAVDETNGDIYVTDHHNNRIQKWMNDAKQGNTVAGSINGTEGMDSATLTKPADVLIDEKTKTVYVVDTDNQRIQRWLVDASSGDTIVGGSGKGNSSDQFNEPTDMAFDSKGNLYVSDLYNHRVQMFALIDNQPCSSTSTASATTESTPTSAASATTESTPTSAASATTGSIPTSITSTTTGSIPTSITTGITEPTPKSAAHPTMIKSTMIIMVFSALIHVMAKVF